MVLPSPESPLLITSCLLLLCFFHFSYHWSLLQKTRSSNNISNPSHLCLKSKSSRLTNFKDPFSVSCTDNPSQLVLSRLFSVLPLKSFLFSLFNDTAHVPPFLFTPGALTMSIRPALLCAHALPLQHPPPPHRTGEIGRWVCDLPYYFSRQHRWLSLAQALTVTSPSGRLASPPHDNTAPAKWCSKQHREYEGSLHGNRRRATQLSIHANHNPLSLLHPQGWGEKSCLDPAIS